MTENPIVTAQPTPNAVKIWFTAVRPFAYPASALPVILGLALVVHAGHTINWALAALTMVGVLSFHTAANLLNDCFDHHRGTDDSILPTSGAIVRGWLTEKQVYRAALVSLGLGMACGAALIPAAGWLVFALGSLGTLFTVGYTRRGRCLKYAGLGDVTIFIAFGLLPVFGTYWVQTRTLSWLPILWSLPLASLTVGILHANNWRDIPTDTANGCRTVAARLGDHGSGVYYRCLVIAPYILTSLYLAIALTANSPGLAPRTVGLVLIALPASLELTRVHRETNRATFMMLDARTAQLQLLFGVLLCLAFVAGQYW
mgnify:CR=1 FL=1